MASLAHSTMTAAEVRGALPAAPDGPGVNATCTEAFNDGKFESGVWESDPYHADFLDGGFPVTESMHVLSGEIEVTPAGGKPVKIGPGGLLVLPKGWKGRFAVTEKVRKVYSILY
ncbi:hypothetical protein DFJ74DRAFT_689289 [Hyaloraphidium curvatum]|nr:hypothetical protein DFJ74DRAFT_689289 [Hyaloraphidium curvatum]